MGEQAFNSLMSQPISAIRSVNYSTDTKKQEAMQRSGAQAQRIYESVEAYHERMKAFREELAKRIEAENTAIAEKKYNDILSRYLSQTTDASTVERGIGELQSLLRFTGNNNVKASFDENIYLARKQQNVLSEKLYKLRNGQEDNSDVSSNPMLYNGEFQESGKRDFLC